MVLLLITVIVWSISFQFQHNFGLITDFTAPAVPLCVFAENKLAAALAFLFFFFYSCALLLSLPACLLPRSADGAVEHGMAA